MDPFRRNHTGHYARRRPSRVVIPPSTLDLATLPRQERLFVQAMINQTERVERQHRRAAANKAAALKKLQRKEALFTQAMVNASKKAERKEKLATQAMINATRKAEAAALVAQVAADKARLERWSAERSRRIAAGDDRDFSLSDMADELDEISRMWDRKRKRETPISSNKITRLGLADARTQARLAAEARAAARVQRLGGFSL